MKTYTIQFYDVFDMDGKILKDLVIDCYQMTAGQQYIAFYKDENAYLKSSPFKMIQNQTIAIVTLTKEV